MGKSSRRASQGLGARTGQLGVGVGGLAAGFEDFAARGKVLGAGQNLGARQKETTAIRREAPDLKLALTVRSRCASYKTVEARRTVM